MRGRKHGFWIENFKKTDKFTEPANWQWKSPLIFPIIPTLRLGRKYIVETVDLPCLLAGDACCCAAAAAAAAAVGGATVDDVGLPTERDRYFMPDLEFSLSFCNKFQGASQNTIASRIVRWIGRNRESELWRFSRRLITTDMQRITWVVTLLI